MSASEDQGSDIHLLVGAYALDAVDDIERARFDKHLASCPDCQTELGELLDTAARLGAAETMTPPPSMRSAVFDRISDTPQALPATHMTEAAEARAKRTRTANRWLALAAAVLAVAVASLGITTYVQNKDAASDLANSQLVSSVLTASDAQVLHMPMGDGADSAIVMSPSQGKAVMVAKGVPAAPAGQTYELWTLTASGAARPAGTWEPSSSGSAAVPISGDLSDTAAIAVTVEPSGGSQQPTTKPIAHVSMA